MCEGIKNAMITVSKQIDDIRKYDGYLFMSNYTNLELQDLEDQLCEYKRLLARTEY
jgi:hypothetical protein